ncbi:PREDICTED: peroxidase 10 [Nelumbo nucifera]|uniref:Peroxidase n=1 Tax=Nelumbo nucifera TaxID=4432 RepID=A0A1U8AQI9_NELNU|nr:PREDICTED: peroxidase 10 [Nelumbo nucifera]
MNHKSSSSVLLTIPFLFFLFLSLNPVGHCELDYYIYNNKCPDLFRIVKYGVWAAVQNETRIAASLLRLHFHDCLVNGCDGSVLLDATAKFTSEKNALPNRNSARGFEVIEKIKADVEAACPSIVSCADILAIAARDAVVVAGGPFWLVPLGRRDGTTASEETANQQLPSPFESLNNITAKFTSKGLELKDVVVLSGAHTIGYAQCFTFKRRLFDFNGSGKPDKSLDSTLLQNLQSTCPKGGSDSNLAPLDSASASKFDNGYYSNLAKSSGLLESDQALMNDPTTASIVNSYTQYPYLFYKDFAESMVKMGNLGVLTGNKGQIRKKCGSVN